MNGPQRAACLGFVFAAGLAACNPSGVFIDPTGKQCTPGEPCPNGWSCVPSPDGTDTICWPSADAGLPDSGPLPGDGGVGDGGVLDGGDGGDGGRDRGGDGGFDGGTHDGGTDGGHPDSGVDGGTDGGTPDAGPHCTIGGQLVASGAFNPNNPCQECEPATLATGWTTLADGTACGGGQLCLKGNCGSGCTIAGSTVASGAIDPANSCESCQPGVSTTDYSKLSDGTPCSSGGGDFCVAGSCSSVCDIGGTIVSAASFDPTNPCGVCNPSQSPTGWTPVADGPNSSCPGGQICASGSCAADCFIASAVVASGTPELGSPCQSCDPAQSTTGWSPSADGLNSGCPGGQVCASGSCTADCFIGGKLVSPNGTDPSNMCQQCVPTTSVSGWTPTSDGTPCSSGGGVVCASGACADDCYIGNTLVPSGTFEPGNPCSFCAPLASVSGWSAIPNGPNPGCPSGDICASGSCASDCYIGGAVVSNGALDPSNPCQSCQPSSNTTAYTDVATGTACGTGLSCNAGSCCNGAHGTLSCSGKPVDTCLDDDNCGSCGASCPQPNGCFAGVCQLPALLPTARDSLAVATGPDGRIYAMGGYLYATTTSVATVEIFDPRTNLWSTGPSMPTPVEYVGAVADATGVFVMGGYDCNGSSNCSAGVAEKFGQFLNTSTQVWSTTGNATVTFDDTFPAIGPGGVFFMPGGYGTVSGRETLEFTPTGNGAGGSFSIGSPQLPILEGAMAVTAGLDGTIYCINGTANGTSPNAEVYTLRPGAGSWTAVANDPTPRCDLVAATDANGLIYAIAGDNCAASPTQYANNEIFNPGSGTWSTGPALPSGPIAYAGATVGPEGRIYVIGGLDFQDENYVQVYDPVNGYWIP